jgi:hypothetical protein
MYNATDDLTDQDKVSVQYRNLLKNKFKTEQAEAKEKDYRKSWKYAVMDMVVGVLIMVIYGFIMYLPILLSK